MNQMGKGFDHAERLKNADNKESIRRIKSGLISRVAYPAHELRIFVHRIMDG